MVLFEPVSFPFLFAFPTNSVSEGRSIVWTKNGRFEFMACPPHIGLCLNVILLLYKQASVAFRPNNKTWTIVINILRENFRQRIKNDRGENIVLFSCEWTGSPKIKPILSSLLVGNKMNFEFWMGVPSLLSPSFESNNCAFGICRIKRQTEGEAFNRAFSMAEAISQYLSFRRSVSIVVQGRVHTLILRTIFWCSSWFDESERL